MKKISLVLFLLITAKILYGQGKVGFANDSLHLVYYCRDASVGLSAGLDPRDVSLAGQGVTSSPTPSGITLVADLYMGTASSSLFYYSSTTFSSTPGIWNTTQVQAASPFIGGGANVFVAVQIRDNQVPATPFWTGFPVGSYYGKAPIFHFTLGAGITYPPLWGSNGDWPVGSYDMSVQTGVPGSRGAIEVGFLECIPEPSSLLFTGMGCAALCTFRKKRLDRDF